MEYVYLVLSVCLLSCLPLSSSVLKVRKCQVDIKEMSPKANFLIDQMEGAWYQYGLYTSSGRPKVSCTKYKFTQPVPGEVNMKIATESRDKEQSIDVKLTTELSGVYITESTAAGTDTSGSLADDGRSRGVLIFVDTDYDCWAITYWCEHRNPTDMTPVISMSVFLRNNSDTCVNAKTQSGYSNIMAQFTDVDTTSIKWHQTISSCKMEPKEEKPKEAAANTATNKPTQKEDTKDGRKKKGQIREE